MTTDHLSDEALYALGERPADLADDSARGHLAACAPCRTRAERLRAGAALVAMARADKTPDVRWSAIDAKVFAAAETVASDIRRGRLRPARALSTTFAAGLTLAAAAAGIFGLRMAGQGHDPAAAVLPPPSQPAHTYAVRNANPSVRPVAAAEGVVLMVAAPVEYIAPDGAAGTLEMTTNVREGGRLRVREGGRAVVAMHTGARLDARSGAEVRLARVSSADVALELSKGEARVDGAGATGERTTLAASGWTVEAKGGSFVAKVENDLVRLRVVSGKVGVSQSGRAPRDAMAGEEVELSKDGGGYRVVSRAAHDGDELAAGLFAEDGRVFALPALPGAVTSLRAGEQGALPTTLRGIRASAPVSLTADVSGETYTLELAPAAPAPTAWGRAARSGAGLPAASTVRPLMGAVAQAQAQRTTRANGAVIAPPEPSAVAVVVAEPAPQPAAEPQVITPEAPVEVASAGDREADRSAASRALSVRSAQCFRDCEAAGACDANSAGYVALDTEDDGRVSAVRAHGFTSASLAACVEREARGLRVPRTLRAQHVQLDVARRGQ